MQSWSWYLAPNGTVKAVGYGDANAYTDVANRRIVLEERAERDGPTTRHEMLHALLGAAYGSGGSAHQHPPSYFRGRCAGVVLCDEGCFAAGAPPDSAPVNATVVPPSSLSVTVDVVPRGISRTDTDPRMTIVLQATNASTQPVWVQLDPTPGLASPAAYWAGYRIVPASQALPITNPGQVDSLGAVSVIANGRVAFAAGQTRWVVFDLSASAYPAAAYQVVGIFNTRQIAIPLTVTP